jgi:hypothetical protein
MLRGCRTVAPWLFSRDQIAKEAKRKDDLRVQGDGDLIEKNQIIEGLANLGFCPLR